MGINNIKEVWVIGDLRNQRLFGFTLNILTINSKASYRI